MGTLARKSAARFQNGARKKYATMNASVISGNR
jgi:hypothetical protein